MFKFNPKNSFIFKITNSFFLIRKSRFFKILFLFSSFIFLLLWALLTAEESLRVISPLRLLGLSILSFSIFLFFWYLNAFFRFRISRFKPPLSLKEASSRLEEIDFAQFFNYKAALLLKKTIKSRNKSSVSLLYYLLRDCYFTSFVFSRLLLDKESLLNGVASLKDGGVSEGISDCLKETMVRALSVAEKKNKEMIDSGDLLVALAETNPFLNDFLTRNDIRVKEVDFLVSWHDRSMRQSKKRRRFWEYENLTKIGSLGEEWVFGSGYLLKKFSENWTKKVSFSGFRKIIGHEEEVDAVERILAGQNKNNVILVGEIGTGRTAVVDELAGKIFLGNSLEELNHKKIYKLRLHSLIANLEGKEDTEKVLDRLFSEAVSVGNIILVIENIHDFISGEERSGVVDISGVLEDYLKYPGFKIIGITNYKDYRRKVEPSKIIESTFQKVEISEISPDKAVKLCEMIVPGLERKHNVFITYQALIVAVDFSDRYLKSTFLPEKAMHLLEEAVVLASQKKKKVLRKEDVAKIVSEKAEVPVGNVEREEKKVLLNLENEIHKRIINQEIAIKEVSRSLRRSRAQIDTRTGLIGSFLFLGPTGVGKTETAKAIAEVYFGSEKRMVRLDMSEYQNLSDISKMIGSKDEEGVLTEKIIEDPFSLILLDELEKAHPDILNLFLQVLDEGHVTDGLGRKVDFTNCMIVATSNAGYQKIMEAVKEEVALKDVKKDILEELFEKGTFRPEFVNRFDGVILFEPLSKDNLANIAHLQLEKLKKNLKEKGIEFKITNDVKTKIVEISYDPVFGAREMQRIIQNKIGDTLASALLSDSIKSGDRVKIKADDFSLVKINKKEENEQENSKAVN